MATNQKINTLYEQIIELPNTAQVELLHRLAEVQAQDLDIYDLDDEEVFAHSSD